MADGMSENLFESILKKAQAEIHRRVRSFPVSEALLKKAIAYRNKKWIHAPWSLC